MDTHKTTEETTVIGVYNDMVEANVAREKLKEGGIDSFFVDENVVGLNPLGGIELKIFTKDAEKASKLLQD